MFVFFTSSGGQNNTDLPKEKIKPETKDKATFYGSNEKGIDLLCYLLLDKTLHNSKDNWEEIEVKK